MKMINKVIIRLGMVLICTTNSSFAFFASPMITTSKVHSDFVSWSELQVSTQNNRHHHDDYLKNDSNNNNDNNNNNDCISERRRHVFLQTFGIVSSIGMVTTTEPALATYSSYSHREQDWTERSSNGEVTYKTAKDLRRQLAEIAPMNNEGSKIFCPNGMSANVSPLMENKCGDKLAIPSVYGRTEDTVGNSVPGFSGGFYAATAATGSSSSSSSLSSELGNVGYGFTTSGRK
jgi:hypothetical protein